MRWIFLGSPRWTYSTLFIGDRQTRLKRAAGENKAKSKINNKSSKGSSSRESRRTQQEGRGKGRQPAAAGQAYMYAQPTPNTMSFRRCLLVHVSALVGLATASTASGSAGASSSKGSGAVGFTFLRQFAAPRCRRVLLATRYISCASTGDVDNDDSTNDTPTPVPSIRIQPRHRHLLDQVITNLTQNAYHNIVVVNGAGVSTSCGIPDFRTPGTGLYSKLEEYKLPYPEAIFELDYFRSKPQAFATLAKEIWPGQMEGPKPSRTHAFLRVLQDRGVLRRVYTQSE